MTTSTGHYDVCFESRDWVRPASDVQAGALRDRRYLRGNGSPVSLSHYCWTHSFFVFDDASATVENLFRRLTGLWTAPLAKQQCNDDVMTRLRQGTGAELWLLFHRVVSIETHGSDLIVHVAPTAAGFQIVNVVRPARPARVTFQFVDPNGRVLARLTERLSLDAINA